ncbi:hypothetical protein COCON_G00028940 [Conger conger]|uniref:LITAF domain-containing protein n=1 Tax=Conger conger TaxID=82655 RepID=A0A9Q1DYF4_CONCO|nr:lipopolysaccharide-induced tumor necrosis factor-alpha factor homolog [Conger conger]KAJ8284044.1 hypothetical protein COCON_G00028940 [Conger conger]
MRMSTEETTADTASPAPYNNTVEGNEEKVKVYHSHTVFNPPTSTTVEDISKAQSSVPVYSNSPPKHRFVSYETVLGRSPGMMTCTSCQQQVMTNVTYKVGAFAWLMCFVFIFCGLFVGCCLIPFFVKHFKEVYHSCPRCNGILHVDKPSCC